MDNDHTNKKDRPSANRIQLETTLGEARLVAELLLKKPVRIQGVLPARTVRLCFFVDTPAISIEPIERMQHEAPCLFHHCLPTAEYGDPVWKNVICEGCLGTEETHRGDCSVAAMEVLENRLINLKATVSEMNVDIRKVRDSVTSSRSTLSKRIDSAAADIDKRLRARIKEQGNLFSDLSARIATLEDAGDRDIERLRNLFAEHVRTQLDVVYQTYSGFEARIENLKETIKDAMAVSEHLSDVSLGLIKRVERLEEMCTNRFTDVKSTPKFNGYNGRPCPYCHEIAHEAGKHDHVPVERLTGFERRRILISRILEREGMALTERMSAGERKRMDLERETYVLRAGLQSMPSSDLEEIVMRRLEEQQGERS